MHVERIQVEEGFLDRLDLTFTTGLNVLIGPRGVGKTSVLELIRFALGVESFTDRDAATARQHALAVLGSGRVTVSLIDGRERISVSRSGDDDVPQSSQAFVQPVVLGQNEIESIGLSRGGRLRLIDQFRPEHDGFLRTSRRLRAQLESQTEELAALTREIAEIDGQIDSLADVHAQLLVAEKRQSEVLASAATAQKEEQALAALQANAGDLAAQSDVVQRTVSAIEAWGSILARAARARPSIEQWPSSSGEPDELRGVRAAAQHVSAQLESATSEINSAQLQLSKLGTAIEARRRISADEARDLRARLDAIQQGSGAITRQVALLRERAAQLGALSGLRRERDATHSALFVERGKTFDELALLRQNRYQQRREAASALNARLGPAIRIDVIQSEINDTYVNAVSAGLRGSGLHYSSLAPLLASRLSPRELVEAVEKSDIPRIAQAAGVAADRAVKVAESLRQSGTSEVIAAVVEDGVHLSLLDGKEYKDSESLSTGQRCTVILPILLAQVGRCLALDQPEDHLDNAFITQTLLPAMTERKASDQLIVATHNPNIPVLGEAEQVTLMGSDGKRGFVRHSAALDDPQSVRAITNVMEGGIEAFMRRAAFYREHSAAIAK